MCGARKLASESFGWSDGGKVFLLLATWLQFDTIQLNSQFRVFIRGNFNRKTEGVIIFIVAS